LNIVPQEFGPNKVTKIALVDASVNHPGSNCPESKLERPTVLSMTEVFMGVVFGDGTKSIFTPKEVWEPA
jgi:hypothetical protein